MAATVSAKTVRAVLGAARALGLDAALLADARGLGAALTDVDARFPHAEWLGLWQDIIQRTPSDSIGIDAAERLPWGHWDVIDYLIGTSDNLGTALRRFERYFAVISTGVTHKLETHDEHVHVVRHYAPDCYTRLLAPAEFAFGCIVVQTRLVLGVRWSNPEHVWSLDEILDHVAKQPALFQPGDQYSYSNTNYILLGEILGGVSGRNWRDVVRDRVFARAGLEHTSLPDPGDPNCPATCAHGYVLIESELLDVTRVYPSMASSRRACADHDPFRPHALSSAAAQRRALPAREHARTHVGVPAGARSADATHRLRLRCDAARVEWQPSHRSPGWHRRLSELHAVRARDRPLRKRLHQRHGNIGAVLEPILARVAMP